MSDPNEFKFDVRVRERFMAKGELTAEEMDRYIAALPDSSALAELITDSPISRGRGEGRA